MAELAKGKRHSGAKGGGSTKAVPTPKHDVDPDREDDLITEGMRSEGHKYGEAVWEETKTPPEGEQGFSEYEVGNQDNAEAPAAFEGARAIAALVENGHIDSHERFDQLQSNKITGFER